MVDLKNIRGIYLYPDTVNFCMGIPSLTNLIFSSYKESETINCLYVFFSKNKKQIKMIEINDDGVWLYNKRLNEGTYILPNVDGKVCIDKRQLILILKTIKRRKVRNNV